MKEEKKFPLFGKVDREYAYYRCMTHKTDMEDMYNSKGADTFIKLAIGAVVIGIIFIVIGTIV